MQWISGNNFDKNQSVKCKAIYQNELLMPGEIGRRRYPPKTHAYVLF